MITGSVESIVHKESWPLTSTGNNFMLLYDFIAFLTALFVESVNV